MMTTNQLCASNQGCDVAVTRTARKLRRGIAFTAIINAIHAVCNGEKAKYSINNGPMLEIHTPKKIYYVYIYVDITFKKTRIGFYITRKTSLGIFPKSTHMEIPKKYIHGFLNNIYSDDFLNHLWDSWILPEACVEQVTKINVSRHVRETPQMQRIKDLLKPPRPILHNSTLRPSPPSPPKEPLPPPYANFVMETTILLE